MPVIVTTLLALGSYAATMLARRRRRAPGRARGASAGPPRGVEPAPSTLAATEAVCEDRRRPHRDAA